MSSFLEQILALAPVGESPYGYAANVLGKVLPEKASWFFWMLGAGSIVNAVNLVLNVVCIYMVGARRKLSGSSPYWFVRLQYDHLSGVPYLVPNALMIFLLFNGIFALLMQPYIWINYVSYKHRTKIAPETGLFFWYGFIFIFDGSGMWISAFGTFYATLLPQLLISPNYAGICKILVHPALLNALCYGLPLTLLVAQVITSAQSQIAWHDMLLLEFDLVDNLNILSRQWESGSIDQSLWNRTLVMSEPLVGKILDSRAAFVRNAVTTGAWYTLCFVFFSPSAIWLLYTLHRTIERKLWVPDLQLEALGPIHSLQPPSSRTSGSGQTTPTSVAFLAPGHQDAQVQERERVHDPGGKTAKKLQTAFYSATLQFIVTGSCLGAAAGSWIWAAVDVKVMMNPTLHALAVILSVWIYSIVGIVVNVFICNIQSIEMSFGGSHRSTASLSANQAPPSPFANKLRLANPSGTLLPPIPPPAPLGLPDMDTISLESNRSKPQPIPPRRSTSPLRGTSAFDRSMDPEVEDEDEVPWGERPPIASSPLSSSPGMNRFASTFATRVNALFADSHQNRPRMSDAEIEAEAERSREASRREAERILTEEAAARRKAEEETLAQRAKEREQQQRMMERAQLGRPVTPTRGMSLSPMTSPKREATKEGESSWWEMAKSKLTPTKEKEKDMTPAQQIAAEARKQEKEREKDKGKKSVDWPATPGIRSTDPTLLAMAAASRLAASPINDNHFVSSTLSSSPERQQTYSPKPIMPHEQLAREIEAQGGGRVNNDFLGTRLSIEGTFVSTPNKNSLPFANRATPSPAPSPLQPARAQTSPAQIGLSSTGTPLGGRSPNASPDKSPNVEKDKKLSPLEEKDKIAEREKEKDRRTATTITTTTTSDDAPPLYAQFTPAGALDVPLTLLTVARRFEKLEKWTVGHVRALEERMKDVERYLVDKETKTDAVGKEIAALKTGIQDIRRNMESLRESIPPPAPPPPQPQPQSFLINPPSTPARRGQPPDADSARMRAMSSTSASSYATALSALNGELSNAAAVRTSVISLGSVEEDGIDVRPSVAEVVTPMAVRQPLPPAPSTSASTSSLGSPSDSTSRASLTSPRASGSSSREFRPVVPSVAKDFTPPPPLERVSSGSQPQSPPSGGLRSRLPYPSGDYTSNGQAVSPLSATAAQFPMPPGASNSTLTLSATAPLSIDKEKQKERDDTPLVPPLSRGQRAESVSPTPRKRYTVALSGGDENQRPVSLPTQTAVFTTAPNSVSSPSSSSGRSRSQSTYSTAPQPPPSPSPASGSNRLRRAVSSSTDGGLASVYAQTEDWEDVRGKVLTPRLGEPKFVDPLVIRRKGAAGKDVGSKPLPGAGRGKVPISQLVKFFDGDK
ncbi:unnamed protein product [Rhizoctonia solani]|uniref:Uncharacterized protein n=1 Tax=Rhizoctonia solani TaxID=456999 RepID=A0A8H2W5Q0_9AGAM|nr:unnamed protein product [Rhizoctonia solani]